MPTSHQRKQDFELLLKGAICALIGAIILLAIVNLFRRGRVR